MENRGFLMDNGILYFQRYSIKIINHDEIISIHILLLNGCSE